MNSPQTTDKQATGKTEPVVPTLFTKSKPTEPGWYWCRNQGDRLGEVWEAIALIEKSGTITSKGVKPDGLVMIWIAAPGEAGVMHERDWSEDVEFAGPIERPTNTTSFRGKPVE